MWNDEEDFGVEDSNPAHDKHDLTIGDICMVNGGKHDGKKVIVLKAGVPTKFGVKAITVSYPVLLSGTPEKVWVEPKQLMYIHEQDAEVAQKLNDADYQQWKARRDAGVPPASHFSNKKPYGKRNY